MLAEPCWLNNRKNLSVALRYIIYTLYKLVIIILSSIPNDATHDRKGLEVGPARRFARNYTMTIDILSLLLHLRNAIYLTSPITFTQQLIITRFNGANFYKVRLHIIK